jgi:hypothetical protein
MARKEIYERVQDVINNIDWSAIATGQPKFFHGTVLATSVELSNLEKGSDKLPMIYLLEVIKERVNNDDGLTLEVEADVRLFFLAEANIEDWNTDGHYTGAIKPMRILADMFIEGLKDSGTVGDFESYTLINHAKWGVYTTDRGTKSKLFPDDLSGCELQINIPFLKECECC